ncbi:ferrochelatase [Bartonella tamiae]|uniref:Ferrochelatase n=1 Tax=Bartonella tamiae Th239 TaxID=1094558 RepID=J0ZPE5_9HYPH|nr:ferrochelatase [Bartonella tamiae]EJF90438.1 ferrochelatase [Bartonella tamiae Th239]EJF93618.1 ferrochelatase [Bartonella tamiae Th307]
MRNAEKKIGVVLINLGTPEGTDPKSVRKYLRQFLSDRRVIEWPRLLWYPVLYGIVLNVRPKKSGALYKRIWNNERNESPLRTFTRAQAEKLAPQLSGDSVVVDYAMRYGKPSIEDVVNRMIDSGCEKLLFFPLYPQYSAATTATVFDAFFDGLKKRRYVPAIRSVPPYSVDPVYIDALARSIEKHLKTLSFIPEKIIASYHGIPRSYANRGDPYPHECEQTTLALRQRLGMDENTLMMTFQSRFGPEEWLKPYTDITLENLPKQGVKSVAVFNPGFVVDCLETVDEIGNEAAETFYENGGENFFHIPCLNDSEEGMKVIEHLVRQELAGWV